MKKLIAILLALSVTDAAAQWSYSGTNRGKPRETIDGGTGSAPITRIQLRRDTNANRALTTPASGECIWTTDTKMLYCGDGSTVGGNMVGVGDSVVGLLDDVLDVYAPTPTAGQVLQYGTFNGQSQYGLGKISAANIEADAIIGSKIAADAVDGSKIATGSITSSDIQDSTILGGDIFNGTIAAADIGEDAVGTSELDDGSDTPSAGECVKVASTTSRFEYGSCAGSVVAYDTVEEDGSALTQRDTLNFTGSLVTCADGTTKTNCAVSIPAGHVTGSMIQDGSIAADDIGSGAVTGSKLATGSVGTDAIANGTIASADFSPSAVDEAAIAPGAVTFGKVDSGAIGSPQVIDDSLTVSDVANGLLPADNPAWASDEAFFGGDGILFEGFVADDYEGTLGVLSLTADRLWSFPDKGGYIVTTTNADGLVDAGDAIDGELVKNAGVSGGQTVNGGTASGNGLTLTPNSAAANGLIKFGVGAAYDAAESRLLSGTQTPTTSSASEQGGFTSRLSVATSYSTTIPRTVMLAQVDHADAAGVGFGGQVVVQAKNSASEMETQGRLVWEWSDPTDASEDADVTIECKRGGSNADCLKIDADSTDLLQPLSSSAFVGGSFVWDPSNIPAGTGLVGSFTCTGANQGDVLLTGPGEDNSGVMHSAVVDVDDSCILTLFNPTGSAVDPVNQTWKWRVIP